MIADEEANHGGRARHVLEMQAHDEDRGRVSFNSNNGANPQAGVTIDANGDLFGTTYDGGTNGGGTLFEIKNTGTVAAPIYASTPHASPEPSSTPRSTVSFSRLPSPPWAGRHYRAQLAAMTPAGGKLQVEALVANLDIGFVKLGQEAVIKVSAFVTSSVTS
jgi:hypothetical protein